MKNNYTILMNFYKKNYKNLIFLTEKKLNTFSNARMYCYNYSKEILYFSKIFNHYLPCYIDNYDNLIWYDLTTDIEKELLYWSKKIWDDSVMITRKDINKIGLFGELFLEFFMRIVEDRELFLTYASKKAYGDNTEIKGIDSVLVSCRDKVLELYLCETKFVSDLSSASKSLISDINGENNHVNKTVINNYVGGFALKKQECVRNILKSETKMAIDKLNRSLITDKKCFIDSINELGYKIRFVFFAIYQSSKKEPEEIKDTYDKIIEAFYNEVVKTGIKNYDIDIVFVPTNHESTVLKQKMVDIYE